MNNTIQRPDVLLDCNVREKRWLRRCRRAVAVALLFAAMDTVCGAAVEVGTLESREWEVAADTVQTEDVVVASRGVLNKTGDGKLTLPVESLPQSWALPIGVRQGELVVRNADALPEDVDVTAILQKAKLWLEADRNVVGPDDAVEAWLDARETGDGTPESPYRYVRAVADTSYTSLKPCKRTQDGNPTVYFNETFSGTWMDFRSPDGTPVRINDIIHAYFVEASFKRVATFLGTRSDRPTFQSGQGTVPTARMWEARSWENVYLHAARTYRNGDEIDALASVGFPVGFCLVDTKFLGYKAYVDCLMNDRGIHSGQADQRMGGEHLSAVVLFDCELTEPERMALERHFLRKYGLETRPKLDIRTAKGAKVTIDESEGTAPVSYSFEGEGALAYAGGRDLTLPSRFEEADFCGWIDYGAGRVTARWAPPMGVKAGEIVTAASGAYSGENAYSRTAGSTGRVEKDGDGELCVRHVDSDVSTFKVKAGRVNFAATLKATNALDSELHVPSVGTLPNPSVENVQAGDESAASVTLVSVNSSGVSKKTDADYQDWHARLEVGTRGQAVVVNTAVPSSYTTSWGFPTAAADGTRYIIAKQDCDIWTTFTVPDKARYQVRFKAAPRSGYDANRTITVKVGASESELTTVGSFVIPRERNLFEQFVFDLGKIEAEIPMQLWFVGPHDDVDATYVIDAVEVVEGFESVPNGGFERVKSGFYSSVSDYRTIALENMNTNKVVGWNVTQAPVVGADGVYSGFTTKNQYGGWFYNSPWSEGGQVQLYLSSKGAYAETTFTPDAGIWCVRAKSALNQYHGNSAMSIGLRAEVLVGGETIDLGRIAISDFQLQARLWPYPFAVDGKTPVTLKIVLADNAGDSESNDPHAIVDDVELVAPAAMAGSELIQNGSFEKSTDWTYFSDAPVGTDSRRTTRDVASTYMNSAWGGHACFDDYLLLIRRCGGASQRIVVGVPGFYRIRLYAQSRSRGVMPNEYLDPAKVCLVKDGVTNECFRFEANVTNFTEIARIVQVPHAGEYEFLIQGTKNTDDESVFVDGVSMRLVAFAEETPGLPEAMNLDVATGAKINLDFTGTNRVGRVRLGGKTQMGVISAETYPDYVTGPGALFTDVPPPGLLLLFK